MLAKKERKRGTQKDPSVVVATEIVEFPKDATTLPVVCRLADDYWSNRLDFKRRLKAETPRPRMVNVNPEIFPFPYDDGFPATARTPRAEGLEPPREAAYANRAQRTSRSGSVLGRRSPPSKSTKCTEAGLSDCGWSSKRARPYRPLGKPFIDLRYVSRKGKHGMMIGKTVNIHVERIGEKKSDQKDDILQDSPPHGSHEEEEQREAEDAEEVDKDNAEQGIEEKMRRNKGKDAQYFAKMISDKERKKQSVGLNLKLPVDGATFLREAISAANDRVRHCKSGSEYLSVYDTQRTTWRSVLGDAGIKIMPPEESPTRILQEAETLDSTRDLLKKAVLPADGEADGSADTPRPRPEKLLHEGSTPSLSEMRRQRLRHTSVLVVPEEGASLPSTAASNGSHYDLQEGLRAVAEDQSQTSQRTPSLPSKPSTAERKERLEDCPGSECGHTGERTRKVWPPHFRQNDEGRLSSPRSPHSSIGGSPNRTQRAAQSGVVRSPSIRRDWTFSREPIVVEADDERGMFHTAVDMNVKVKAIDIPSIERESVSPSKKKRNLQDQGKLVNNEQEKSKNIKTCESTNKSDPVVALKSTRGFMSYRVAKTREKTPLTTLLSVSAPDRPATADNVMDTAKWSTAIMEQAKEPVNPIFQLKIALEQFDASKNEIDRKLSFALQRLTRDRARSYVRKFVSFEAGKGQLDSVELRLQTMRLKAEKKSVEERMRILAKHPIFLPMLKKLFGKGRQPSAAEERFVLAVQAILEQGLQLTREEFFALCSNLDFQDFDNEGVVDLMLYIMDNLKVTGEEFRAWLSDHMLPIPQGVKLRIELERTARLTSTKVGRLSRPRGDSRPPSMRNFSVAVNVNSAKLQNVAKFRNPSVFSPVLNGTR